jgi:hypothetical protein
VTELERLQADADFLLKRIHEWANNHLNDRNYRDWFGHVEPAIERVRAQLPERGEGK